MRPWATSFPHRYSALPARLRGVVSMIFVMLILACDSPVIPGRAVFESTTCPATVAAVENRAYDFRPQKRAVVRWPRGAEIRVALFSNRAAPRNALLDAAFTGAVRAWNRAILYGEYRVTPTARLDRADVVIRWADEPVPVEVDECPPALGGGSAVTTFCPDMADPGRLAVFPLAIDSIDAAGQVKMLVTLNGSIATGPALAVDSASVAEVVAHELGHVLGMGHAPCSVHLMWSGELTTTRPTRADRATVQVLYHTEPDIIA